MSTAARGWFRVHSWTGVVTGLLLFVVCWSGTVATLSHELDWLLTPGLRVAPGGARLGWDAWHAAALAAHPGAKLFAIEAPLNERAAAVVRLQTRAGQTLRVFVNPYTAEVTGAASGFGVQRFFRDFHMRLYGGLWGYYLVFSLGAVLLVSLAAPIVFYKRWWQRFFVLKTGRGSRVFWSDAHKLGGLWSLWFVLLMAVTGVWYLAEAVRFDVGDGKFAWAAPWSFAVHPLPALPEPKRPLPIADLMVTARAARPDLEVRRVGTDNGYFYVDGQSEHWLVRDRANKLYLDPRSGAVVFSQRASDQPFYWRWSDTADPLHFGDFAGLASKLVWFVFGLFLSGLCLTGAYLHGERLVREAPARNRARWPGTTAAILATLAVLGASVHGGLGDIKAYGPVLAGIQEWPEVPFAVIAFIGAWVLVTLAMIAAWLRLLWRPRAAWEAVAVAP